MCFNFIQFDAIKLIKIYKIPLLSSGCFLDFTALYLMLPSLCKRLRDRSCYKLSIDVYLNGLDTKIGRILGDNRSGANCWMATATRSTWKRRTVRASTGPTASYRTAKSLLTCSSVRPEARWTPWTSATCGANEQFSWLTSLFSRAVSLLKPNILKQILLLW